MSNVYADIARRWVVMDLTAISSVHNLPWSCRIRTINSYNFDAHRTSEPTGASICAYTILVTQTSSVLGFTPLIARK
ncbi:hypothetical protein F442_06285 [Phytophthora nicotianae P10297]|uniref:Uncharacterized protein n=2 Tax=Phytophthora nicotianae TaxID=4792 RepID=W2ZLI4_PHYNI|nr:hypothetical protein L915_06118 [Phytophthora nicotianae]ETL43427.1 hypothetical protein L916_06055 [Phytophthora nicotianae]ETL96610.1 hypothetical protein L917_05934 [Phytophthora nicotianae]ETP47841.1 hypothetical protein F442_06285 [Phytophthora nicotianae P10297]